MMLIAEEGSLVSACLKACPNLETDVIRRLGLLEEYDFGFLLLGLSPRRLLSEGRLFDNEQVLPLLLWFGQWDKHCRYWASEIARQWTVFNPSEGDLEAVSDAEATAFRDYFQQKYAIPLIEDFRQFVALCMIYPQESNAPAGPVDMVWHTFILHTNEYAEFSRNIWLGAPHMPPEVPEEPPRGFNVISA